VVLEAQVLLAPLAVLEVQALLEDLSVQTLQLDLSVTVMLQQR
jgi:hypothetical protein